MNPLPTDGGRTDKRTIRVIAVISVVIATLAGAHRASAGGVMNISTCQTLNDYGTVYRLTTDLTSCGDCLVVANDQITVDLQGHSITSTCLGIGVAIFDLGTSRDVVVVKNGTVSGYAVREQNRAAPRRAIERLERTTHGPAPLD